MISSGSLPVHATSLFRLDKPERSLFYTPGYVVIVNTDQAGAFEACLSAGRTDKNPSAELRRRAALVENKWLEMLSRPFKPLCLTLYLNNECNLACSYCYATSVSPNHATARLAPEVIRSAAVLVATNCAAQDRPFTVVFHGGGEPALNQRHIQIALDIVEQVARDYNLKLFRYIATNGVMTEARAAWLARRFDQVGISCDGPEEIQSRQRPLRMGGSSTPFVERTAQVIREMGKTVRVRVTITPDSLKRQAEIADYICRRLKPREIYVEPVYQGGRTGERNGFIVERAKDFVDEFFRAREVARTYEVPWITSGSRPAELHGPYCNLLRDVLNLLPEGLATACFKIVNSRQLRQKGLTIGKLDSATGNFSLDDTQIRSLRQKLSNEPTRCKSCINRFHCVRFCPDQCMLETSWNTQAAEFRCQIQRLMTEKYLWQTVEHLSLADSTGMACKEVEFGETGY